MNNNPGPSTRSIHLHSNADPTTGAVVPPIYDNAAFAYEDVDTMLAVALGEKPGNIYSRNTNPTVDLFESKMAGLEGTERATAFATGMAAIHGTLFALLDPSKRAVSIKDTYGASYLHFTKILPRFGIDCEVCETEDTDGILKEIDKGCNLLYLETPTNPTLKIVDIEFLSSSAHKKGAIVIVDNTFGTPINQNPIELGADLVIHSATKFINGHSDVLGGVVCGSDEIIEKIFQYRELTGPSLSVQNAHLLLRSLKTLGLRVERHNKNAMKIAQFLENQPEVDRVFYPGLASNTGHEIAKKQMRGFGGVLSFSLKGGYEAIKRFLPNLEYAYMAANLGQVETVVGTPATTSHVELTADERTQAGIPEGLVRYSAGIEDSQDLIDDIKQALQKL